jgi:type IV secretion system protein TrbL
LIRRGCIVLLASGCLATAVGAATPAPASASVLGTACGVAGWFSGLAGKACKVATGPVGGILKKVLGGGASAAGDAKKGVELLVLATGAVVAADAAVKIVSKGINDTTSPQLTSTWFSSRYWRVTAIAALLALPFLFAAAVQALMRSDMTLLIRAAFVYLPLALLITAIAAPLTMLLLAASDEMSAIVSSAATGSHHFLGDALAITGVFAAAKGSPFLLILLGTVACSFAVAVWLELAVREAAIYVIVLMLPLMFSAMVWPARRVWAIRAVETLVALILSKFVIVAVLSLGSGALGHVGVVSAMAGIALLMLAAFSPWMLLRLLPMAELAGAAAGSMGGVLRDHGGGPLKAIGNTAPIGQLREGAADWLHGTVASMRGQAEDADALHVTPAGRYGGTGGTFGGGSPPRGGSEPADDGPPSGGGGPSGPAGGGSGGNGSGSGGNGSGGAPPNGSGGDAEPPPVGATASGNGASDKTSERLPGLGPAFQAANYAHRDTVLGPDEYPAPPAAHSSEAEGSDGGEHRDPLPERQPDPEDEL